MRLAAERPLPYFFLFPSLFIFSSPIHTMRWLAHAFIGATLTVIVLWVLSFAGIGTRDLVSIVFLAIFGGICALVPDLDHENSKGRKVLDLVFIAFSAIVALGSGCGGSLCIPLSANTLAGILIIFLALLGAYFILFRLLKPRHRGITHTVLAGFVFFVLVFAIAGLWLAVAGLTGYLSHLLADGHLKVA